MEGVAGRRRWQANGWRNGLSAQCANDYGLPVLRLPDAWVWDSWYVDDGVLFHAFTLKASRALLDPERRHHVPVVGHSVSDDLVHWREVEDAFVPSEPGHFDDQGIWTGSIVRDGDSLWHLFFTGIARARMAGVQRIGHAVSEDLVTWRRVTDEPIVTADPRWYETQEGFGRENWRDPWVFREGDQWRMLMTAQSSQGPEGERGCIATAVSSDLQSWTVQAPLAERVGLNQLEVLQTLELEGRFVVVFCLTARDVRAVGLARTTGTWTAPADSLAGPFHLEQAEPIAVEGNYAGRVVRDRLGRTCLMAFVDVDEHGRFGGCIGDPVPLTITDRGTLQPACAHPTEVFRGLTGPGKE